MIHNRERVWIESDTIKIDHNKTGFVALQIRGIWRTHAAGPYRTLWECKEAVLNLKAEQAEQVAERNRKYKASGWNVADTSNDDTEPGRCND